MGGEAVSSGRVRETRTDGSSGGSNVGVGGVGGVGDVGTGLGRGGDGSVNV